MANGIHLGEGGALCAACRMPRPYSELLAFVPVGESWSSPRVRYVCRPSVSDMRFALCTSKVLKSAALHRISFASDVAQPHRDSPDGRATDTRHTMPEHVRRYVDAGMVPA